MSTVTDDPPSIVRLRTIGIFFHKQKDKAKQGETKQTTQNKTKRNKTKQSKQANNIQSKTKQK